MKRTAILTALVLTLVIASPLAAVAGGDAPVATRIIESGKLRVGMTGSQPPYGFVAKNGKVLGYEVDIAELLAEAMDVELEIVQMPFADLLPAIKKGKIDIVMSGMTMTPRRNLQVAFVGPYQVSGKSILTKSKTIAAIVEAEELDQSKARIVALKDSTSQDFVKEVWPDAQYTAVDDYEAGVAMVITDKADALVADYPICAVSILRHPEADLVTLDSPLTLEPIGIAVPPGDTVFLNMVENSLGTLELIGVLEILEERWFDNGGWLSALP
ncbi:MAG: transporter substrate-binding domain-containing protein [Acidobacteriota bacterium]